ncbi:peptide chain release factor N(5)-glutamine methyltransferase [Bosea sp. 124]|uniref:peptide chain release factor N(5)-glutamine methyltransferase n=1 Tax=Bosea sp. 124 TaxID=2135642 RepID=UPI000D4872A2|nr:peptide chain release factor N(5)-glutamine methyltransferase [Bosea sp. 124]PTM39198.1 release factor glutamine methyltransferase [Bosea sp. 124]
MIRPVGAASAAPTVADARRALAARLLEGGSESAALDARIMLEGALGERDPDPFARLDTETEARLDAFAARRLADEPVWRILGEREFWGLPFRLSAATLEPRPDSETLVEAALACLAGRRQEPLSVLDLGTGTGCLLIAVLSECPAATGLGIDLSPEACETARSNAVLNGVSDRALFQQGSWTEGLNRRFDLILSNPPYIRSDEIATLDVSVREHDPRLALDGGDDGLQPYRVFAGALAQVLAPGGLVVLEIGAGQEADVISLMRGGGFAWRDSQRDLGGHPRALIFTLR